MTKMTVQRLPRSALSAATRARAPVPMLRHRAFVARIRRGASAASRVPGVTQVLRRSAMRVLVRQRNVERFVARLTLRELAPVFLVRAGSTTKPGLLRETRHRETRSGFERIVEQRLQSRERNETRIVERRTGVVVRSAPPAFAIAARPAFARVEQRAAFPPLARTLVRASAAPPTTAVRSETAPPPFAHPDERRAVTRFGGAIGTPETVSLPPAELARVTKHVIGELDRRVLSYRERTGQV
jgi:hypothetical protein